MKSWLFARARTCVMALSGVMVIAFLGCSDKGPTTAAIDEWSSATLVGLRVNAELIDPGNKTIRSLGSSTVRTSLLRAKPFAYYQGGTAAVDKRRTHIRHQRTKDGRMLSIGYHYARDGEPPTFVYMFEQGRIKAVMGAAYEKRGTGYVRTKTRVTLFDSLGNPTQQVIAKAQVESLGAAEIGLRGLIVAIRDIATVALPRELHAEEGPCSSEYVSYFAASIALAAATAALQGAAAACPTTGGLACPAAGAAFVAWSAAVDKWSLALDKLLACTELQKKPTDDAEMTSGDYGDDLQRRRELEEDAAATKTVTQFIQDSIMSGNYKCSSDGSVCTYYAAE